MVERRDPGFCGIPAGKMLLRRRGPRTISDPWVVCRAYGGAEPYEARRRCGAVLAPRPAHSRRPKPLTKATPVKSAPDPSE